MNQMVTTEEGRNLSPSQQFRFELEKMGDQFAAALPSHIKPEKFQRVVITAVLSDPDILKADRKTLMEAAIRAAQDGLLPDKREGAFVVYNTKVKIDGKDTWIKAVQWMPMVGGIIKRVHQSGDIKMLTARVVYGGDHFRTWIDDTGEHIEYEPAEEQDTSVIRRVFAMATTVDGAVYVEPLSARDVEKIRNVSRSKDRGPWADWWEEMAKKSAIRRLAKRLPLSVDIHDLIQRDNGLYDLSPDPEQRPSIIGRIKSAQGSAEQPTGSREGFSEGFAYDQTETLSGEVIEDRDPDTGEITDNTNAEATGSSSVTDASTDAPSSSQAGASKAEGGAPASTSTSPATNEVDKPFLIELLQSLYAAKGPDKDVVDAQSDLFADRFKAANEITQRKAKTILTQIKMLGAGEVEKGECIEYLAGVIGVEPADLDLPADE